jgi:hypothetical protein
MRVQGTVSVCLAVLLLGGCQSMTVMAIKAFDQKPYSLPVSARELAEAGPAAPALASVEAVVVADAVAPTARTDVAGLGDGAMTDTRVVVTGRKNDIPHRVPEFSREQAAAMVCAAHIRGNEGKIKAARRAYDATVAADEARIAFDADRITLKQWDAVELKRQDAVKGVVSGGMLGLAGSLAKKADLPKPEQNGVVLESVDLFTFNEAGKPVMAVSGVVRNTTDKRVSLAPLTLEAIDRWEFVLAGQTSLLPFETLEPGETRPFEVRFHNPPETTYEVYAHFAPPFEYRTRRDCDLSDPASATMTLAPRSAEQAAAVTAPMHTAAELNQLVRVYRAEAESAWGLRMCSDPEELAKAKAKEEAKSGTKSSMKVGADGSGERRSGGSISIGVSMKVDLDLMCAAWAKRAPWREMFAMAETADEAWGAMLAAAEQRRQGSADADAAETASRGAYAAFREAGAKLLARGGPRAEGVSVAVTQSSFGYEPISKAFDGKADISSIGYYVDVTGEMRNTGATPKKISGLMLALVDRLEQPLLTYRIGETAELAPGEARPFKSRVFLPDPVQRKSQKDTPPWQVRVGAIGQ